MSQFEKLSNFRQMKQELHEEVIAGYHNKVCPEFYKLRDHRQYLLKQYRCVCERFDEKGYSLSSLQTTADRIKTYLVSF